MSTIPPRPWRLVNGHVRDRDDRHVVGVTSIRWTVPERNAIVSHIAEAVNAYDGFDAAIDAAQVKVSAAELRAEAAESRADDLAGRLRIAEEEIGRLRAKLVAVGVGDAS